jgi:hypothetical protein
MFSWLKKSNIYIYNLNDISIKKEKIIVLNDATIIIFIFLILFN